MMNSRSRDHPYDCDAEQQAHERKKPCSPESFHVVGNKTYIVFLLDASSCSMQGRSTHAVQRKSTSIPAGTN